ncbi:MAG: thiol-disulfide isomerase/thioredoxin [Planctomycetota bacterium]|jgi:thiol-disulfide isomerase/thioredoxin
MLKTIFAVALCLVSPALAQHPTLFRDIGFQEARELAKKENKLMLLDAMTSWCGPCKVMDATTWVDPKVESWIAKHTIAIQLDMDLHEALKKSLAVKAFPTMILFNADGKEFDRIVGLRTAEPMLEWLGGALGGHREIDRVRAELTALVESGEPRTRERMSLAARAAELGANHEVAAQILWLWARDAADENEASLLTYWRSGPGRNLTSEFLARFGEWREPILAERNQRSNAMAFAEFEQGRSEWITLNGILGDQDRTVVWAAGLAIQPEGRKVLKAHERQLFTLLVDQGLWAAAGHCLAAPLEQQRFLGENLGAYDVKPTTATQRKSVPMIPMGGVRPAQPVEPKTLPAIPMGGMRPAKAAQPVQPKVTQEPKAIPMIPMSGPKPTKQADNEAQAVPMIPMAVPKSAQSKGVPAVPMVSMGGPKPKRPETPEEIAADVRERLTHQLRYMSARRYGALLASGRLADAEAVAMALLRYADDDAARAALISCALRAGCVDHRRAAHLDWLDSVARGAGQ